MHRNIGSSLLKFYGNLKWNLLKIFVKFGESFENIFRNVKENVENTNENCNFWKILFEENPNTSVKWTHSSSKIYGILNKVPRKILWNFVNIVQRMKIKLS